jgi:hypothetical protein
MLVSLVLTLAAALAVPGSALASGSSYDYGVVHDYCGDPNGFTNFYKVREISSDTAGANRLTIDSWAQEKYFTAPHPHWVTVHNWARAATTFTPNGTYHHLTVARKWAGGNVEQASRIVMRLRAWDHGLLAWSMTVRSTIC